MMYFEFFFLVGWGGGGGGGSKLWVGEIELNCMYDIIDRDR